MSKGLLQIVKDNLPNAFIVLLKALETDGEHKVVQRLMEIIHGKNVEAVTAPVPDMTCFSVTVAVEKDGKPVLKTEETITGLFENASRVLKCDLCSVIVTVKRGSVITHLQPLNKHALETLKLFCKHVGMKAFGLDLLKKKDIFATLPAGKICLDVQVCCHKEDHSEDLGAYEPQRDIIPESFEVVSDPQVIKMNLLLQYSSLLEEIEPIHIKKIFIDRRILSESFFQELKNLRRRERVCLFLNKILDTRSDQALIALVDALKGSGDEAFAAKLCYVGTRTPLLGDTDVVDDSMVQVVAATSKTCVEDDLLWSCHLEVMINKNENESDVRDRSVTSTASQEWLKKTPDSDITLSLRDLRQIVRLPRNWILLPRLGRDATVGFVEEQTSDGHGGSTLHPAEHEELREMLRLLASANVPGPQITMKYEMLRLCTRKTFPGQYRPFAIRIAEAGFYSWVLGDIPLLIHQNMAPDCGFLTHNALVNVPIRKANSTESPSLAEVQLLTIQKYDGSNQSDTVHCESSLMLPSSEQNQISILNTFCQILVTNKSSPSNQLMASGRQNVLDSMQAVPADTYSMEEPPPKYPQYAVKNMRINSFQRWPAEHRQRPEEMAECGFYYAGLNDCVRCFSCGVGLRHWISEDDPWIEHARWSAECIYVRKMKGEEFVSLVKMAVEIAERGEAIRNNGGGNQALQNSNETPPAIPGKEAPNKSGTTNSSDAKDLPGSVGARDGSVVKGAASTLPPGNSEIQKYLLTDAAQSVLDMGYQPKLVLHAIERVLMKKGSEELTGQVIMDSVLEIDEEPVPLLSAEGNKSNGKDLAMDFVHISCAVQGSSRVTSRNTGLWTESEVADAGFYYTGLQDTVRCFACDGGLKNWDPEDEPWVEHARWFPQCLFVKRVKGQEFIDLVRRMTEDSYEDEDAVVHSTFQPNNPMADATSLRNELNPHLDEANINNDASNKQDGKQGHEASGNIQSEESQIDPDKIVRKHRKFREATSCKICLENTISVVFLPYGHLVTCPDCALSHEEMSNL